jgi:hypothetical protein
VGADLEGADPGGEREDSHGNYERLFDAARRRARVAGAGPQARQKAQGRKGDQS